MNAGNSPSGWMRNRGTLKVAFPMLTLDPTEARIAALLLIRTRGWRNHRCGA